MFLILIYCELSFSDFQMQFLKRHPAALISLIPFNQASYHFMQIKISKWYSGLFDNRLFVKCPWFYNFHVFIRKILSAWINPENYGILIDQSKTFNCAWINYNDILLWWNFSHSNYSILINQVCLQYQRKDEMKPHPMILLKIQLWFPDNVMFKPLENVATLRIKTL